MEVSVVRLTMSLLVESVEEDGLVLESDALETVLTVFNLLIIPWPLPTSETKNNVLDPETGPLQVFLLFQQSNIHFNPQDDCNKRELVPEPESAVPSFKVIIFLIFGQEY